MVLEIQIKNTFSLRKLRFLTLTIATIGIVITGATAWQLHTGNLNYIHAAVEKIAEEATAAISERFKLYQYGLSGTKGVILASGENDLTRKKFVQYSQVRDIDTEFPGARGFGFIRRVAVSDEAEFLEQARQDDAPSFSIRQLTPNSIERYVIQYIEPSARNIEAIGLDIGSEANRRKAADDAMKTGTVQLTGPITLVQASGKTKQAFLILAPVYRPGSALETEAQRVSAAFGWSYAPLLMEEVLADLDIYNGAYELDVIDVTDPSNAVTFFRNLPEGSVAKTDFDHSIKIEIFGRVWLINLIVTPEFIRNLNLISPEAVLGAGTAASIALALLFAAMMSNLRNRRDAMERRAELASIVESSFDAIIGRDLSGIITSWNPGATALFGYSQEEALGKSFTEILVPLTLRQEEVELTARLESGQQVENFETQRLRKNGTPLDVSVTASPIRSKSGEIIGSSKTMRDFTEQKRARIRISEMNENLEARIAERTAELTSVNSLLTNILRSASDVAIIATNENGLITLFNSGAEHLLGYDRSDAIDKMDIFCLFKQEELGKRAALLSERYGHTITQKQALFYDALNGRSMATDWTHIRKDTTEFNASTIISEIQDEEGTHRGFLFVSINITQQYNFRRQLEIARNQLEMAADVAEMGVWSWEVADNSLQWNDHMFKIYGYPETVKNKGVKLDHWTSRLAPKDIERAQNRLSSLIEGTNDFNINFEIITPAGEQRVLQAGADVERDEQGNAIRVTGFNLDITDQIHREELLQQAKESADRANVAKSNFLANMSHEIRTPMNAVLGMLQLTQQTDLTATQNDYLTKAQSSAKALLGILNDILDYSKIEAGKLELDMHEFELHQLFEDLADTFYGSHHNDNVDLIFNVSSDIPMRVISDGLKLQQVLTNLAGNALKFTQNGYVCISVTPVTGQQALSTRLRFAVEDTGIGISDQQLARLFTGFTQAEASTTRRFGGTGLGLTISESIVAALGGKINVESQIDQGSVFSFELEFDVPASSSNTAISSLRAPSNEAIYLLSVTDKAREIYQKSLTPLTSSPRDCQLVISASVAGFIKSLPAPNQPNQTLVTMIIDEHGLSDDDTRDLVNALAAFGTDSAQIVSLCRQESNLKKVDPSLPLRTLQKPFTSRRLHAALERTPTVDGHETINIAKPRTARLAGLNILVVEDNLLNREVAKGLLQSEGATVSCAVNGLEGVEKALAPNQTYDFVMMDVQMPEMDGMDATREIRKFKSKSELPIIAMTANASNSDRASCLDAGMNAHLSKPIDPEELVSVLIDTDNADRETHA
ncbi:MAG: CHASE domain-containing protein [Thalassospira sp.]|uniref:PAS domain-containing hybrid sensor histidine kinase/response regulator n=1 Tax=Thalassospira sp. TaxID=1912094 RepID=UPI0032EB6FAC